MIHVSDHRHVTDVGLLVHDGTDLVYGEVHLKTEGMFDYLKKKNVSL